MVGTKHSNKNTHTERRNISFWKGKCFLKASNWNLQSYGSQRKITKTCQTEQTEHKLKLFKQNDKHSNINSFFLPNGNEIFLWCRKSVLFCIKDNPNLTWSVNEEQVQLSFFTRTYLFFSFYFFSPLKFLNDSLIKTELKNFVVLRISL
jgi:hypothetical protein